MGNTRRTMVITQREVQTLSGQMGYQSNQGSKNWIYTWFRRIAVCVGGMVCSPREDSHLYSPGGSVVVSRQANLVQGHTAHMMSPLTWRDRTRIHVSSLSFLISYSGSVFTKCWTTTPNTTIQNILLQTCIWNVSSSNLVWSATVHLLNTPFCNNAISNLQWLLNPPCEIFHTFPQPPSYLPLPITRDVLSAPCKFLILFARIASLNNHIIKQRALQRVC
jgi:hypothetical protein